MTPMTEDQIWWEYHRLWKFHPAEEPRLPKDIDFFAKAIIAARDAQWAEMLNSKKPVAWGILASDTGRLCMVELDANEVVEHDPKYVIPLYTHQ